MSDAGLERRHDALVRDLTATLDIDAGLRAARAQEAHDQLVADLGETLDVAAGLAAVLPPPPAYVHGVVRGVRRLAAATLESLPPSDRILERNHPAVLATAVVVAADMAVVACQDLVDTLALLGKLLDDRPTALANDVLGLWYDVRRFRARAHSLALVTGNMTVFPSDLDSRLLALDTDVELVEEARTVAADVTSISIHADEVRSGVIRLVRARPRSPVPGAFDDAPLNLIIRIRRAQEGLQSAVVCARELERIMERADQTPSPGDPPRELAVHEAVLDACLSDLPDRAPSSHWAAMVRADALDHARNDFTGADLRGVPTTEVNLEGVRWSETTLWPAAWMDDVRRDSVEIRPGVFEIRPGTADVLAGLRGG